MRRAKEAGRRRASPANGSQAEAYVASDVEGSLVCVLPVEVAVIPDLVAFSRGAQNELGPTLGIAAENEERRPHVFLCQCIQNLGRRVRVRAVVESERYDLLVRREPPERGSEDGTVPVECSVSRGPDRRDRECRSDDHSRAVRPRT